MEEIVYGGHVVARVTADQGYLDGRIGALERGHPVRRFVAGMCVWALEIERGVIPGPYTDERAARYTRWLFMPPEDFGRVDRLANHELAEHFNVPLEQVEIHRQEVFRQNPRTADRG